MLTQARVAAPLYAVEVRQHLAAHEPRIDDRAREVPLVARQSAGAMHHIAYVAEVALFGAQAQDQAAGEKIRIAPKAASFIDFSSCSSVQPRKKKFTEMISTVKMSMK